MNKRDVRTWANKRVRDNELETDEYGDFIFVKKRRRQKSIFDGIF